MMSGFSFNRLAQVLRWDVEAGWRSYLAGLWAVASILLLMFVVDLLWYFFSSLIAGEFLYLGSFVLQYILLVLFCPLIISFCCWLNIKLGYKS